MTPTHPPRLATWLLKRFGFSRYTQTILGDLTESYQSRQTTLWYWKQVAIAIIGSRWREVRSHIDQSITLFRISGGHMRKAIVFVLAIVHAKSDSFRPCDCCWTVCLPTASPSAIQCSRSFGPADCGLGPDGLRQIT